ncbi:hypothetical protein [Microcoleus vaginatus]|uniref:hypothetical protein n=1 Tax=Microcoleus vaginatus TaxID=119532 RepID=UPI001F60F183|nr:hypothetical protein D0A37_04390 [Microcoleus vaginatus HSN003]
MLVEIRSQVFDCAKELQQLRGYSNTVDINAENYYIESYAKIQRLSIKGDNLVFLPKFRSLRSRKYQSQIEKYLNYLIANQDFFPQTISTIRGMVEIKQVELNRVQEERARQRDRQQLQLYKQKEQEQKDRDREQMEIGRKNEDK